MATAISSVAGRGLVALTGLLSIRLTLGYLGPVRFGLWMTIASLQTVFSFADIGLGYSVLQMVSEAFGRNDRHLVSRTVWTALAAQVMLVVLLLIGFWACFHFVRWDQVFHVENTAAASDAAITAALFIPLILIRSVVQVVQQAQYGMQAGYIANIWSAAGNLASMIGLYACARQHAGVPVLCLTVSGLPVAFGLANVVWWLSARLPRIPSASNKVHLPRRAFLATLFRTGFLFFLLQLSAQLTYGIDPLIVNRVLGAAYVSTFTVVQKPFEMLSGFLMILVQPLWPAYREAIITGDVPWIRRTFWRALILCVSIALLSISIMAIAGGYLIRLWAGPTANPPDVLIYAYCATFLFSATQTPQTFFLNGIGRVRFQLLLAVPVVVASMLLKIILAPRYGLVAIPAATVVVGITLMIPAQIIYIRRVFQELHHLRT
jgi:O-antigen/teichoic acid export membrane protein